MKLPASFPALVFVLLLAAWLRFTGLGWGLRHVPSMDERYFVESTGRMLASGDFDHRFYEYPGLLFYLLAPVLAPLGPPDLGASAYLAGRALVASFGVASVGLVFLLGRRTAGAGAGLAAALLVAVSPVEVQTAHMIRPDVVLETFVLLAFMAFEGVGARRGRDALAGAAMGAALAVKFSGLLLVPSYVLRRLLAGGPEAPLRGRALAVRLALAALAAAAAFVALSPYSVLHLSAALEGARTQVAHHYVERGRGPQAFGGMVFTYGLVLLKALGAPGSVLAAVGAGLAAREWRRFAPLLAFPVLVVAVFSTAEVNRDRFLVPALGVVTVLAGLAVAALARRSAPAAAVAALVAAGPPLLASHDYVRGVSRPSTRDLALDWIEAHVPAGARILTTQRDLGIDRRRFEVLEAESLDRTNRPLALDVDLVVCGGAGEMEPGLEVLEAVAPETVHSGAPIRIARARAGARPRLVRLPLDPHWLSASESGERTGAMLDGDLETAWRTSGAQRPGTWIQLDLPAPATVGRVELWLGRGRQFGRNVHLYLTEDGRDWKRVAVLPGRPPVDEQVAGPGRSQLLVFEPVSVRGLRLVQVGRRERPWAVAELEVFGLP